MNIHLLFFWPFCEFIFEMCADKLLKMPIYDILLFYGLRQNNFFYLCLYIV